MTGVSRGLHRTGLAIAAIGTATAGFGGLAVRSTAQFAESMQKVVGLSGVAQGKIAGLTDEVLKLAPAVGRSPQELADALFFITSSGIKAADAIDVLTVSAKASVAGLGETQTVADAVTSAMNAYGAANLNAKAATDVLVATVREGKGEASAFAGVLGNVIPIASQLGVSFNEVGAALAAQTRLGTSAETATIQLQAVFSGLLKSTPKTAKAFASVGLNIDDLRKQLTEKGLLSVLDTLKTSFGDNTKAMANAFGNVRALRGVLALVGKQADQVRGVFNRMRDSTSALGIAFGAVSKDTAQQFRKAQAAAQVAVIQIGAALAPLAGIVAKGLTVAATALSDFIEKISAAKGFKAKFDVVFQGVKDVASGLFQQLRSAFNAINFGEVFKSVQDALSHASDVILTVFDRINWSEVGRTISDGLSSALRFLQTVNFGEAFRQVAERIFSTARALLGGIDFRQLGSDIGNTLVAALNGLADFVNRTDWNKVGKAIVDGFKQALKALGSFLKGVNWLAVLGATFRAAVAVIKGFVVLFGTIAIELGKAVIKGVGKGLAALPGVVIGLLKKLPGAWLAVARFYLDQAKSLGKAVVQGIARGLDNAKNFVLRKLLEFVNKILGVTGFLGRFDPFKGVREKVQKKLAGMEGDTKSTTSAMQKSLSGLHGKDVKINVLTPDIGGIQRAIDGLHGKIVDITINASVNRDRESGGGGSLLGDIFTDIGSQTAALAKTQSAAASSGANATTKAAGVAAKAQVDANNKIAAAAKNAADKAKTAFDRMLSTLQIGLQKAQLTPQLQDDIKAEKAIIAAIKERLKVTKNDLDLQGQLVTEQGNLLAIQKQQKDALKAAIDSARQRFGTLFQVPDTATTATFLGGTRGRQIVPGTGTDAASLKKNLDAQVTAFRQVTQNIATLVRRGAPPELVRAARAGELTPQQINTLAHANKTTLQAIFRDVRIADKLVARSARMEVKTPHVTLRAQRVNLTGLGNVQPVRESGGTTIHIEHFHSSATNQKEIEAELTRAAKRRGNQRRGRTGGHR